MHIGHKRGGCRRATSNNQLRDLGMLCGLLSAGEGCRTGRGRDGTGASHHLSCWYTGLLVHWIVGNARRITLVEQKRVLS